MYGMTSGGGADGIGTAFELMPLPGGGWKQVVLRSFHGRDGFYPGAGLILDSLGNLYGVTPSGGPNGDGCGLALELLPAANGDWSERVLHYFDCTHGKSPQGPLLLDASGDLYGTTSFGGDGSCGYMGCGIVYELIPSENGKWVKKTLHAFNGNDGEDPAGGLVFDKDGDLYGFTSDLFQSSHGTIFELIPLLDGKWRRSVLHRFQGPDGAYPAGGLIIDMEGNLYGVTPYGGVYATSDCHPLGCGLVFKLTRNHNRWTETILYAFSGLDGANPVGVIFDSYGNLYGTTSRGGTYNDGTVFKLSPETGGHWSETLLHTFDLKDPTDGAFPAGGVAFGDDAAGNLYGTTEFGGQYGAGVVYEVSP